MQMTEVQEYRNSNCEVLGLATSGVPMEELEEVNALLGEHLGKEGINYIGAQPMLHNGMLFFPVLLFCSCFMALISLVWVNELFGR
jgi:hypothetical protein